MTGKHKQHKFRAPDYLIPVVHLIRKNVSPTEAFEKIAKEKDVVVGTARHFCTRKIKLKTQEFVDYVNNNAIKDYLVNGLREKYPKQKILTNDEIELLKTKL